MHPIPPMIARCLQTIPINLQHSSQTSMKLYRRLSQPRGFFRRRTSQPRTRTFSHRHAIRPWTCSMPIHTCEICTHPVHSALNPWTISPKASRLLLTSRPCMTHKMNSPTMLPLLCLRRPTRTNLAHQPPLSTMLLP